jgi:hypothetical protein
MGYEEVIIIEPENPEIVYIVIIVYRNNEEKEKEKGLGRIVKWCPVPLKEFN